MLCALPRASLGIILFPREPRLLPLVEDDVDKIGAEVGIHGFCAGLVGAGGGGDVLVGLVSARHPL